MENEAEAFGNPGIEEVADAAADDGEKEAEAFGGLLELEDAVDDDVEAAEEEEEDDDDDDVEAVEDLDDVEARLFNRLRHIVEVDLRHYNPDAAAVGRVDALFRDNAAELDASAEELRAARAELEGASSVAAAANAAPVLPRTEQERARARARHALEEARRDVEDLAEHRWALVQIVLGLVLVRAVAVSHTRMHLLPAVLLAFIAAEFVVAYASGGAYVAGGTSTVTRVVILTALWMFGY